MGKTKRHGGPGSRAPDTAPRSLLLRAENKLAEARATIEKLRESLLMRERAQGIEYAKLTDARATIATLTEERDQAHNSEDFWKGRLAEAKAERDRFAELAKVQRVVIDAAVWWRDNAGCEGKRLIAALGEYQHITGEVVNVDKPGGCRAELRASLDSLVPTDGDTPGGRRGRDEEARQWGPNETLARVQSMARKVKP